MMDVSLSQQSTYVLFTQGESISVGLGTEVIVVVVIATIEAVIVEVVVPVMESALIVVVAVVTCLTS